MSKMLYMGTNLKMYKTIRETVSYLTELHTLTRDLGRTELTLFVIPSYTSLESARKCVPQQSIKLGTQNMHWEDEGQFTGEISPVMIKETGAEIIEIGHSERRHVMGETDQQENRKVLAALRHGFTALLCIGETKEQKDLNISDEVLSTQLKIGLSGVTKQELGRIWIGYEPVWAIGVNGIPASADYADQKHGVIKAVLKEMFGEDGHKVPVLYGGSVNPKNAPELIVKENIDGLFVGRSAWNAPDFNSLIRQVMPLYKQEQKM